MDTEHIDAFGEVKPGPFFRTPYNYDVMAVSDETGLSCSDPSLAQQQFKDDADINVLVARYGLTGKMPDNPRQPSYGDFTGVSDYRSAIEAVKAADEAFMALPGPVRAEFLNDPQVYLEAFDNPANEPRLRELGFLKPRPAQPATPSPSQASQTSPAPAGSPTASAVHSSTP